MYFKRSSSTLELELYTHELNEIISLLKDNQDLVVIAEGYINHTGSDATNAKLSAEHAETLCNYLIKRRISADHITIPGYGKDSYTAGQNQYEILARRTTLKVNNNK